MRELQLEFEGKGEVKGIFFHQIAQSDKTYIYHRSDGYYEVFARKVNTRFNCISYPNSNSFGIWAWCTGNRNEAYRIFDRLNHEAKQAKFTLQSEVFSHFLPSEVL